MNILPIVDRIKSLCPSFTRGGVQYVYPYGSLPEIDTLSDLPLVEIDEPENQAESNVLANTRVEHRVIERVAFYIAAPLVTGSTETLAIVRAEIRNAMLGWIPSGNEYSPFVYVRGQRITRDEGATGITWWMEIFETSSRLAHDYQ